MESYSTHWRATIFAAILLHCLFALIFSYVLPYLAPEPKIEDVAEFEWIDVDLLPDNVIVIEEGVLPSEIVQETLPTFKAEDLFVPEFEMPEVKIEPLEPPSEIKPLEPPKPQKPQVIKDEQEARKQIEENPDKEVVVVPKDNRQLMGKPPVPIMEVYPEQGSGLGYKGYVLIAVTIGKDGKVKDAEVIQSSGRLFVDEITLKSARQWTFKPALDQNGKQMVSSKIITFDFKKFS